MNDSVEQRDIQSYLRPLRVYWWLILAVVVIVTGGTYVYYSHKPKTYEASTELLVEQSTLNQLLVGSSTSETTRVENYALLIQTRAVARQAAKQLGRSEVASLASISAEAVGKSNFIEITASGSDPQATARVANAYAVGFIASQAALVRREAKQSLAATEAQLEQVAKRSAATENSLETQRTALEERIRTLQLILAQPTRSTGIRQVEPAIAPSSPSGTSPKANALFAFVISLMLGIGAAFGLQYLNRKISTVEGAEEVFKLPVLTEVPKVDEPAPFDQSGVGMADLLHEPFHRLQANLEMLALERPLRTILIASAVPSEGKSLVARNLALAYREAGRKVAVIDADFRKGALGQLLAAEEGPGLTDILTGRASFEEAVQTVQVPRVENGNGSGGQSKRRFARAAAPERGEIVMVPAGSHPGEHHPPASSELREAFGIIPDTYDTVIIDSAPLLAAADVLPLLSGADGVVLVTRLGVSTKDASTRLLTALRRVPHIHVTGLVVNGIPSRLYRSRAYGYYYGY